VFELNNVPETKMKTPGKNNNKKQIISTSSYESLQVTQLKQELGLVKDNLQAVIHDFENANQELQSANEEVLSSNEELQSTNEELETSKEELQSANEELSTVNDELQERNEEMFRLSNDIVNVLNSVQIPIIIVSNDLSIRRYTPSTTKIFNLIPTDIGRPFAHISSNHIPMKEVGDMIKEVLENAVIKEKDIHASDNKWYHLRVRPYKTDEQKIEGAVVTLQENLNANSFPNLMSEIFEMIQNPFVVLDHELKILMGNSFFYECFKLKSQAVAGSSIFEIATNFGCPKLKKMLKILLDENKSPVLNEKIEANFGKAGKMTFNLTARRVSKDKSIKEQILVSFGYMGK
jgi:two-component system CheB/CheR fusion protein